MQSEDTQQKASPVRTSKKSDGWREREEAKAAGVTPHKADRSAKAFSLVRF